MHCTTELRHTAVCFQMHKFGEYMWCIRGPLANPVTLSHDLQARFGKVRSDHLDDCVFWRKVTIPRGAVSYHFVIVARGCGGAHWCV